MNHIAVPVLGLRSGGKGSGLVGKMSWAGSGRGHGILVCSGPWRGHAPAMVWYAANQRLDEHEQRLDRHADTRPL